MLKTTLDRWRGKIVGLALLMTASASVAVAAAPAESTHEHAESLRVLTYNIQIGIGMDRKVDLERTAEVIREARPDLVAIQEVDRFTNRSEGVDQARALAESLGMHFAFGYASSRPGGDYGVVTLSRWPILETSNHKLPHVGNNETRTILSTLIEIPGQGKIRFLNAHLQNALERREERLLQIDHINDLFAEGDFPAIFATDLNAYPDTPEMERMKTHWIDATAAAEGNTYPADEPEIRLDYIFVRDGDSWQVLEAKVIDAPMASDHRPVLAVIAPQFSSRSATSKENARESK